MARRRKNKKQPRPKRRPHLKPNLNWLKPINWHVARRSMVGVAWTLSVAGLVAAWMFGVPKLQAFASQRRSVEPHEVTVRFADAPAWFKGDVANHLIRTASMQVEGDPLQRTDLIAIREVLMETGWFEAIEQVRRVDPDLIEIRARYVYPYTVIEDEDGHHLVDHTGKLLPLSYDANGYLPVTEREKRPVIAITGVHFHRPQITGRQWEGADVTAGLNLLRLIDDQPWRNQVKGIDVSKYLDEGILSLRSDRDCQVIWGSAPGEESVLEVLADGKLKRLDYLYKHYGRIDGGHTGELDITGEKAVVTR